MEEVLPSRSQGERYRSSSVENGLGDDSQATSTDLSGDPCKEPDSLQILREFNSIFEDRLKQIDEVHGYDCVQVSGVLGLGLIAG